jgi:hypothetical protein
MVGTHATGRVARSVSNELVCGTLPICYSTSTQTVRLHSAQTVTHLTRRPAPATAASRSAE